jgi:hypothetical protein
MTSPRSFRVRLLVGSILFTGGLLFVGHVTSITVVHYYPVARMNHVTLIGVAVALGFMIAGFVQMRTGLSPFNRLRSRLSSMRDGQERRIEGRYPAEVQPLVDDLNALLDQRQEAVSRAIGTPTWRRRSNSRWTACASRWTTTWRTRARPHPAPRRARAATWRSRPRASRARCAGCTWNAG